MFATATQKIRQVLKTKVANLLKFTETAEATQYFQSYHAWPDLGPPSNPRASAS